MSVKMKFGSKDIPFVYKGDKLIYPNPIKDGLLLWYDFKGIRNTDTNKEVAKDLSGNGNDGTLTNFNFTEGSGYKDNTLVFDGVDDSLTIPELELDETAMSVMHDGKVYSYEDDKVLTVGEDGEIEARGRNLVLDSGIRNGYVLNASGNVGASNTHKVTDFIPIEANTEYIFSAEQVPEIESAYENMRIGFYDNERNFLNVIYIVVPEKKGEVFTTPKNAHFTRISVGNYPINLMLMKGSVPMDYQPVPEDFQNTSLSPSSLSNLQLYNRPLRKDELLHNAESKGLKKLKDGVVVQDGLVLHYDFSHESNTSEYKGKAFDYSGNGNHGVLNNFNFTEGSGYAEDGLKFDNIDDFVSPNLSKRVTDFTILSTVYFSEADSGMIWGGSPPACYLRRNSGHGLHGSIYISGGEGIAGKQMSTTASNVFVSNEAKKINVGMVVDNESQTYSLIVNGEIIRSIDISEELETAPFSLTHVGTWPTLNYSNLDGSMHSFQMYNRALTPEEIAHNYAIEKERFNIQEV